MSDFQQRQQMPHARRRDKRTVQKTPAKLIFLLHFCASLHSNGSNLDQTKSQIRIISQYRGSDRFVDQPSHLRPLHKFIVFADERIIETKKQCYVVRITSRPNAPALPASGRTMMKNAPLISGGGGGGGTARIS